MKIRCMLFVVVFAIPAVHCCSSTCDAQWKPLNQPIQKPLRLLGHGWSSGYHWRNPGHDSSYYNPYSHHNSYRRSQWSAGAMYSGGFSHSLQTPIANEPIIAPNVPEIDAEFRPQMPDKNEFQESPSSNKSIELQSPKKEFRPAAKGENKKELDMVLPIEFK